MEVLKGRPAAGKLEDGYHHISSSEFVGGNKDLVAINYWTPDELTGHHLKKPVEMELMNSNEHVMINPTERLASQDLSVDWFRFWLQDYEDPNPAKADQYKRWRELRKLQEENNRRE